MKILGKTNIKQRTRKIPIGWDEKGEPVELVMRPVKYGVLIEMEATMPIPVAPTTGIKRKNKSGQVLKRNGKFLFVRDEEDPDYVEKLTRRTIAVQCATVVLSLGDQIGELRDDEQDQIDYWMNVLDDLHDAGIDQGVFTSMVYAATELSQPLSVTELIQMRIALGTEKETAATTPEKEKEAAEHAKKEELAGKA